MWPWIGQDAHCRPPTVIYALKLQRMSLWTAAVPEASCCLFAPTTRLSGLLCSATQSGCQPKRPKISGNASFRQIVVRLTRIVQSGTFNVRGNFPARLRRASNSNLSFGIQTSKQPTNSQEHLKEVFTANLKLTIKMAGSVLNLRTFGAFSCFFLLGAYPCSRSVVGLFQIRA